MLRFPRGQRSPREAKPLVAGPADGFKEVS